MKSAKITDESLAQRRFRCVGCDEVFRRWFLQWNRRQFLTLYQRRDQGTFSIKFCRMYFQGLEYIHQIDDVLDLLQDWGVLLPPENIEP